MTQKYESLPVMLLESADRWSSKTALLYKVRGKYQQVLYRDLLHRVHEVAAALLSAGVSPGDHVAIMSENCPEWAYVDWAVLSLGAVTVPLYPTLMPEQIGHILSDCGAKVVIVGDAKLSERVKEAADRRELKLVQIILHGESAGCLPLHRLISEGKDTTLTYETWREGCKLVNSEECATLIYTSGTTGEPKGAMIRHESFTFLCKAILANLPISQSDRFFSFLPLSHVYERMAGHFLPISCGAEIAYCESLRSMAADIIQSKPTVILAVPRFLESVKSRIESSVVESTWLKRKLFEMQRSRGKQRLNNKLRPCGFLCGLLDKLVASKVRDRFGGNLRFFVSGGAALPNEVAEFYGSFGLLILQGYGLTETAPVMSVNHPERNVYSSVGEVLPGVEVMISADREILMRGPSKMMGYYNRPQETSDMIDADGWLHTGDLGKLENNRLWVTGRKKEIIVMANGKNVSPTEVEAMLKRSPYIDEAMALGDDDDWISALIVPNFELLKHFCQAQGLSSAHQGDIVENRQVIALIKEQVDALNKELPDYERVKRWKLMPEPWSMETGEITPTMKLKRGPIAEKYAAIIADLRKK